MSFAAPMLLAAAAAMAPEAGEAPQRPLVEIFRQACMSGEARFRPGTVSPVGRDQLPAYFTTFLAEAPSNGLGRVTTASYYRIAIEQLAGFLAVEKRGEREPRPQTCSLTGKPLSFPAAIGNLQGGILENLPPMLRPGLTAWETRSPLGYILRARVLEGGHVVLQSSSMSEKERRRLVRRLDQAVTR
jgi:hypothetical protein